MIDVGIDLDYQLKFIEASLGGLKSKAPGALRNALNNTATRVRKQIVTDAKGEYALKNKSLLKLGTAAKIRRAKTNDLTAMLISKGGVNELMDFTVTPTTPAHGTSSPASYSARVLSSSSQKVLGGPPKAFITTFKSGHMAIVTRVPGKRMKSNPSREFVKKLLSPAVPHMLGNDEIREQTTELVAAELPAAIQKQITRILAAGGKSV